MSFIDGLRAAQERSERARLAELAHDAEQVRRQEATLRARVLIVLGLRAMYLSDEDAPARLQAFVSEVYRFTHVANAPGCRKNHPECLADFEQTEAAVWAANAAPNGVPWEVQRDKRVRELLECEERK